LDKTELGLEEKSDNKTESISKPMEKSGIGNQKGIIIGIIIGIIATVAIIALISRGHVKNNEFSTNSEI
jgi:tetrahydromethanopterin S-methyltransferase subunit G